MGDLHVPIVYDIGEVVGGKAVGLDDDIIILRILFLKGVVDDVVDLGWRGRTAETHDKGFPFASTLLGLFWGHITACARIVRAAALFMAKLALACQMLLGAEAPICLALLNQLIGVFVV